MEGLDELTVARLAMLIDGDGCITIKRRGVMKKHPTWSVRHQASLSVINTDRRLTDWANEIVPGHVHYRKASGNESEKWEWEVNDRKAEPILKAILPWLITKKPQCLIAIQFLEGYKSGRGGLRGGGVPAVQIAWRDSMYQAIRALNKKGPPAETEREDTIINVFEDRETLEREHPDFMRQVVKRQSDLTG